MIVDYLVKLCPNSFASEYVEPFKAAMALFGIDSQSRQAMFFTQILHESNGLRALEENLDYSATRMAVVWPSRFAKKDVNGHPMPGIPNDLAIAYEGKAWMIASNVYANRMGNGDEGSREGYIYRGRCPIMITGKDAYKEASVTTGRDLVEKPDLALDPSNGATICCNFWMKHGLNSFADTGDLIGCTRVVNGGLEGLADRQVWYAKLKGIVA